MAAKKKNGKKKAAKKGSWKPYYSEELHLWLCELFNNKYALRKLMKPRWIKIKGNQWEKIYPETDLLFPKKKPAKKNPVKKKPTKKRT